MAEPVHCCRTFRPARSFRCPCKRFCHRRRAHRTAAEHIRKQQAVIGPCRSELQSPLRNGSALLREQFHHRGHHGNSALAADRLRARPQPPVAFDLFHHLSHRDLPFCQSTSVVARPSASPRRSPLLTISAASGSKGGLCLLISSRKATTMPPVGIGGRPAGSLGGFAKAAAFSGERRKRCASPRAFCSRLCT